jgi:uncharacterized protein (TIGR02265 family)
MPVDRRDFDARIAAAVAADTVRGVIFNAIFDAVDEHLGAEAARACDPTGKGRRTDFRSYPAADFLGIIAAAVDALEPKLGLDRGFYEIGYRAVSNVLGSTLGATLLALAGKDLRTFFSQLPNAYRATASYGERQVEWKGERHAVFRFTRDFLVVPFHVGVLTAVAEALGGKEIAIEGYVAGPLATTYDVRWK